MKSDSFCAIFSQEIEEIDNWTKLKIPDKKTYVCMGKENEDQVYFYLTLK